MVAVLGDGVVFQCSAGSDDAGSGRGGRQVKATYFEEMTVDYFNTAFDSFSAVAFSCNSSGINSLPANKLGNET